MSVYYFFNFYFLYISTFFHPHTVHFPVSRLTLRRSVGRYAYWRPCLLQNRHCCSLFASSFHSPFYYCNKLPTLLNMYFFTYFPIKKFFSLFLFNNSLLLLLNNMLLLFYFCTNGFCNSYSNKFLFSIRINHSIEHIYTLIKIYHTYKNLTIISCSKYNNKLE